MEDNPSQKKTDDESLKKESVIFIENSKNNAPFEPGVRQNNLETAFPASEGEAIPIIGSLSDEEVRDLDVLIRNLKAKTSETPIEALSSLESTKLRELEKQLVYMGELLLKFDGSLKTLVEVLLLFQRKSEILHHRIHRLEAHRRIDESKAL